LLPLVSESVKNINLHSWEDNIKVDHIEVQWENVDWINLAEDRQWQTLVNKIMNFQVP
jgi:hypothetical protein